MGGSGGRPAGTVGGRALGLDWTPFIPAGADDHRSFPRPRAQV